MYISKKHENFTYLTMKFTHISNSFILAFGRLFKLIKPFKITNTLSIGVRKEYVTLGLQESTRIYTYIYPLESWKSIFL